MKQVLQLTVLIVLTSTSILASQEYSGYLVDSKCYESASGNVGPKETTTANRDMDWAIRYCAPSEKTKSFALIQFNWQVFEFDANSNAKAAELVHNSSKQRMFVVRMTGERDKNILSRNIIKVESISSK